MKFEKKKQLFGFAPNRSMKFIFERFYAFLKANSEPIFGDSLIEEAFFGAPVDFLIQNILSFR